MRTLCLPLLCLLASATLAHADDLLPPDKPIPEVIDHYIKAALQQENVSPAPLADDARYLRRVMLDLVGRIPTVDELKTYTSSKDPNKKVLLVDRLLATPAFVRQQ